MFIVIIKAGEEHDRRTLQALMEDKDQTYQKVPYYFCDQRITGIHKTSGLKEGYLVVDTDVMFKKLSHIVRADRFVSTKRYGWDNYTTSIGVLN